MLAYTTIFIPPKFKALVFFQQIPLLDTCNFLFHHSPQQQLTLYSHLLDHTSCQVFVQNNANCPIQISRNHRLDCMTEILYKNCFATSIGYNILTTPPKLSLLFHKRNGIIIPPANKRLETEFPNGIKIYGDGEAI